MSSKIKTTGQLRAALADAAVAVVAGTLTIEQALAFHKLAQNISNSLYSETKIAMFAKECNEEKVQMGSLEIGDSAS